MPTNRSQALAARVAGKRRPNRRAAEPSPPAECELSPADVRKQLSELPTEVRRQSWQIQFLVEELRTVTTEVERGVILDWLEEAKRKRLALETELKDRQSLYESLMRGRRRRAQKAKARAADAPRTDSVAVPIRAAARGERG